MFLVRLEISPHYVGFTWPGGRPDRPSEKHTENQDLREDRDLLEKITWEMIPHHQPCREKHQRHRHGQLESRDLQLMRTERGVLFRFSFVFEFLQFLPVCLN